MPEDIVEEEISEQIIDEDGESGFDNFVSEDEQKPDVEKEGEEEEEPGVEEEEPKKVKEKEEEKPPEVPEEELSPQDRIDQIVKTRGIEEKPSDGTPPPSDSAQEELPPKKAPPAKMTKEEIARYLSTIDVDDLPDGEVIIGDNVINLSEYAKDYPDEFNATKVLSAKIAEKTINALIEKGVVVTQQSANDFRDETNKVISNLYQKLSDLEYWGAVMEVHSDARKINNDPAFKDEWLGKQSKAIQTLAKNLQTPEDAVAIIDLYKEHIAKQNVVEFDKKAKSKKEKEVGLHKGTIREKVSPKVPDSIQPDDDERAFDDFAK